MTTSTAPHHGHYDPYDSALTLHDARTQYFIANHFGSDGGYNDSWVEVKFGPISFYIPNTKERVRAVRVHDLHHVVTGYRTDLMGESEIGAWELASGCGNFIAAWYLNLSALLFGLCIGPWRTFFALRRGLRSSNLYHEPFTPELLAQTVGETTARLNINNLNAELGPVTLRDVTTLLGLVGLALPLAVTFLGATVVLLPVGAISSVMRRLKPALRLARARKPR